MSRSDRSRNVLTTALLAHRVVHGEVALEDPVHGLVKGEPHDTEIAEHSDGGAAKLNSAVTSDPVGLTGLQSWYSITVTT